MKAVNSVNEFLSVYFFILSQGERRKRERVSGRLTALTVRDVCKAKPSTLASTRQRLARRGERLAAVAMKRCASFSADSMWSGKRSAWTRPPGDAPARLGAGSAKHASTRFRRAHQSPNESFGAGLGRWLHAQKGAFSAGGSAAEHAGACAEVRPRRPPHTSRGHGTGPSPGDRLLEAPPPYRPPPRSHGLGPPRAPRLRPEPLEGGGCRERRPRRPSLPRKATSTPTSILSPLRAPYPTPRTR